MTQLSMKSTIKQWATELLVCLLVTTIVSLVCKQLGVTEFWRGYFVGLLGLISVQITNRILE